jgi:hypothetical protein
MQPIQEQGISDSQSIDILIKYYQNIDPWTVGVEILYGIWNKKLWTDFLETTMRVLEISARNRHESHPIWKPPTWFLFLELLVSGWSLGV